MTAIRCVQKVLLILASLSNRQIEALHYTLICSVSSNRKDILFVHVNVLYVCCGRWWDSVACTIALRWIVPL